MNLRATRTRGLIVALIGGMIVISFPCLSLAINAKASTDSYTVSNQATTSFGSAEDLVVSNSSSITKNIYLKFDLSTLPSDTVGSHVVQATLRLWVTAVATGSSLDVVRVTSSWGEDTITYNNAPSQGSTEWSGVSIASSDLRHFINVDLTQLVKDWRDGVLTNNGIVLIPNASGTDVTFNSKESTGTSHDPTLEVVLARTVGDITAVNAGTGLTGGGTSGDVTLSVDTSYVQRRVVGTCPAGSSIREIDATGNVVCETDDGTVTSVGTGAGLTGGPITTTGTISVATGGITSAMIADGTVGSADVNSAQVQLRVSGTCSAGNAVRVVNSDGTVTCQQAVDGSGTANYVPKFTASTTVGNSAIYESSSNVGIGTTVTTGATGGDLIVANNKNLRSVDGAGTSTVGIARLNSFDTPIFGRREGVSMVNTVVVEIGNLEGLLVLTGGGGTAVFLLRGSAVLLIQGTPTGAFSSSEGTSGKVNVFWHSGTSTHRIENLAGSTLVNKWGLLGISW